MKITLTKEELNHAILVSIFARTGTRLTEEGVEIFFIDTISGMYNVNIDKVEIEITQ